ncbi:high mobility group protein 20A [Episyrphus balteatus]|uniref:high mobility group protein 20A n=1 Tax=Episyrphus balteatus TaxID=286459 RepID=UPI0024867806|nr:high mobility group protein 20A [Episyrphus balteatus]
MENDKSVETQPSISNVEPTASSLTPSGILVEPQPPSLQEPKSPGSSSGEIENVLSSEADPVVDVSGNAADSGFLKRTADDVAQTDAKRYRLKRRKIKAAGAPKMPLTGYVRYMNVRRDQLRSEFPEKTSIEYTKMIGEEWSAMSEDKKSPFLKEAEVDRQRYITELNDFLKDRPDILASELAKNKIRKRKENLVAKSVLTEKAQVNGNNLNGNSSTKPSSSPKSIETIPAATAKHSTKQPQITQTTQTHSNVNRRFGQTSGGLYDNGGIPIFTEEFLEHNKCVDMELRSLRKSHVDFEQQNAVLEKHVENMKFGVEKMVNENDELQEKNRLLEMYLDKLKLKLSQALSGLAIPTEPNGATLDNIDKYMSDLYKMATTNTHGPASLNKAKDIIRKLDLTIQL